MCGISALFSSRENLTPVSIQAMTAQVRHRGPDDEGYALFSQRQSLLLGGLDTPVSVFSAPYPYCPKQQAADPTSLFRAALGHRRLSILDLSAAGHQPMSSANARYWITYNGEIYNYLELRSELEGFKHTFKTTSDTEVLLKAYEQWGIECLHRFNGMFAFVIYDQWNHQLFAARDRFGVKPLYYWRSPQGFFAIASEIKQFTALSGWEALANGPLVIDYLTKGTTDHESETLFANVQQLKGGEFLVCSSTTVRVERWYTLPIAQFAGDEQEAAICFQSLLKESVRLRLRSDVDVGFCLSGGLDSSSIVCLASQLMNDPAGGELKTFSACSEEKAYDERPYIDLVNTRCGLKAHYTYPSLDTLFRTLPNILWHQDEPFGSTSIYAQWSVFQLVKETGVKVMLDGQGADEQLAGYLPFFRNRLNDLFNSFRWLNFFREAALIHQHHGPVIPPATKLFRHCLKASARQFFSSPVARPIPSYINGIRLGVQQTYHRDASQDSVDQQLHQQLTRTSLPMLLRYEDRNSMAHSVESRTPFLDYRLVEFLFSLPSHYKISHGVTKRVLRQGMLGILPDAIRLRKDKLGFATPEEVWMKQRQPDLFLRTVDRAIDQSRGIIKPEARRVAEDILSGKKTFNWQVWRLINFGLWMERFDVKNSC